MWSGEGSPLWWFVMAGPWQPSGPLEAKPGGRLKRRFVPIDLTMPGPTSCGSFAPASSL